MKKQFIIFLKNRTTSKFEYKPDVIRAYKVENGYQVTFDNRKTYFYGNDKVELYPFLTTQSDVRIYENNTLNTEYTTVDHYGKYMIFRNNKYCSEPIEKNDQIEISVTNINSDKVKTIINYFKEILIQTGGVSFDIQTEENATGNLNQISSTILLKALDQVNSTESRSALSQYLSGEILPVKKNNKLLIYPFGCNESQKLAVETALSNALTIVEGPPGTGKTQTILNIVANLVAQKKTVAIVSNNNSAVFNVREKLQKYGYGNLVASLGNIENRQTFFDNIDTYDACQTYELSKAEISEAINAIKTIDTTLSKCFEYRNTLAILKAKLSNAETEYSHVMSDQPLTQKTKEDLNRFTRKWGENKTNHFKAFLATLDINQKLPWLKKLKIVTSFGLKTLQLIQQYSIDLETYFNHKFYELHINNIKEKINTSQKWLQENKEEQILEELINLSNLLFKSALQKRYKSLPNALFDAKNYRNNFNEFIKRYPVIISSTLSLNTSIPDNFLFDYLIIDESSQVDIIKSAVCFSRCRNVVIVGDSMQLTHIIDDKTADIANGLLKEFQIASHYDYVQHNILSSLKSLYGNNIKSILLKEHYRCHPTIIGFCNKKYYNNNLVVMTNGNNNPFKIIETSISGGRDRYNQRQIDETNLLIREQYANDYSKVGVIAPFRNHVQKLQSTLPPEAEADTIHKYQGREKDTIIFNTVSNQIEEFIDNPNLINVAVSRAVKEFIIVKPKEMELPHGTNIGDLIRYICYASDPKTTIVQGKICSVFDLLYKENNKAFQSFLAKHQHIDGSAAEMIIHKLLTDEILTPTSHFATIDMVREYKLRDLVRDRSCLTQAEISFINNNARLDFLLYSKMDKTPILAIEVDGVSFHDNAIQQERDKKKNNILNAIGLPLLRLSTDGHNEREKIILSLSNAIEAASLQTNT